MDAKDPKLRDIWHQQKIPVVFRRAGSHPLLVRLPWAPDNFRWLRDDKRIRPGWNPRFRCWEVPVAWFDWLIERLIQRFRSTYVIQKERGQVHLQESGDPLGGHARAAFRRTVWSWLQQRGQRTLPFESRAILGRPGARRETAKRHRRVRLHFSYAEQIRAYVPMRYTVLGTDGFRFEPPLPLAG